MPAEKRLRTQAASGRDCARNLSRRPSIWYTCALAWVEPPISESLESYSALKHQNSINSAKNSARVLLCNRIPGWLILSIGPPWQARGFSSGGIDRAGGAAVVSPALQRGEQECFSQFESRRDGGIPPAKDKLLVIINTAASLKRAERLFKAAFSMMPLLIPDVLFHDGYLRRAHAECAISFLA